MGHNALWGVCAEGAGAIKDLCFLHERCSYRLSSFVRGRVAASVSLDWECVVVLLVGVRMVDRLPAVPRARRHWKTHMQMRCTDVYGAKAHQLVLAAARN